MRLEIAERLRPFCHLPSTFVVLPNSSCRLKIFPTQLCIEGLAESTPQQLASLSFAVEGPLTDFTIQQDLEKGLVKVWGKSPQGFFRYSLKAFEHSAGVVLSAEKLPSGKVKIHSEGFWQTDKSEIQEGDAIVLGKKGRACQPAKDLERLSLGNSKAQDWELIRRRRDFSEILPLWYRLGQMVDYLPKQNLEMLKPCCEAIKANAPELILREFEKVFLVGFEGALSPRLFDTDYQGIDLPKEEKIANPLQLLVEGVQLIRSLFLQKHGKELHLLPALPPEFHCGRLLNVLCGNLGIVSIEWSKKAMRRMVFQPKLSQKIGFKFFCGEQGCRLRAKGQLGSSKYLSGQLIDVKAGEIYWFDNFFR